MGYDEDECLFCYGNGNGNNITFDELAYTLCFSCIFDNISNVSARVTDSLNKQLLSTIYTCNMCNIKKQCTRVSLCHDCFPSYDDDSSDNKN